MGEGGDILTGSSGTPENTVEPPIKDAPNKEHLSLKHLSILVPIPIIPVYFNLHIMETCL